MANQEYRIPYTQQQVAASMGREPIIQNRTWHIWDVASMQYIDTGIIAEGTDGSAAESAQKAILAESWAVGGTGTRQGEDTNNAKYWAEHINIASQILYTNDTSGMMAENVQDALDELSATKIDNNATIPIENGGTGATNVADARANLEVPGLVNGKIPSSYFLTIPTSKGGTGATSAAGARTSLSIYSKEETDTKLSAKLNVIGKGVNLLDNWYFIGGGSQQGKGQFPINQRGQTSYTTAGYTIDRWTIPAAYHTLTLQSDCLKITSSADFVGFFQYFPAAPLLGRKVTFSILARWDGQGNTAPYCTFYTGDNTYDGGGVIGTNKAIYSWQVTFPSSMPTSDPKFGVDIVSMTGTTLYIYAVKLEIGDTQTLAREESGQWVLNDPPPNYALELAKCNMSLADAGDSYSNFPFLHIESGSYVGTGTYGASNPNSLAFSFAPKIIFCARTAYAFSSDDNSNIKVMYMPVVTTDYQANCGFSEGGKTSCYGKISSDGKIFYWYSSDATKQCNVSGSTYYYTAIG